MQTIHTKQTEKKYPTITGLSFLGRLASFTWTTCFPLHTNSRILCSSASACLKPDATPPSCGIIHGLK